MAAKIREKDGAYWVVVHHNGKRKWKKIGKETANNPVIKRGVRKLIALSSLDFCDDRQAGRFGATGYVEIRIMPTPTGRRWEIVDT